MMKRILLIAISLIFPQHIFSQIMTIHSQNGQLQQFQISEIDSITFGSTVGTLKWLGHASVKIKTNTGIVIYIDPFAGTDYSEPADLILVSHGHSDHNQVNKITKKVGCQIFSGMGANVGGTKMVAGDLTVAKGIKIKAVEAYNSNHTKGTGVGFVLEIDSVKIYHCGDTSKIPEMAQLEPLQLNFALLCIDGVYNMGPVEAMEAAEIIKPKKVIPIHVAPSNATEQQKQQNIDRFIPPNKLIMKEGDTIYL
jgi:L-ascorbate metabolism protein UlaG (beta-lactamase superfamily)